MRAYGALLICAPALLLGACGKRSGHNETLTGPYALVSGDDRMSMALMWGREHADGSLTQMTAGLPGPTVFAAGHDANFVVVAIHPPRCPDFPPKEGCTDHRMDRSVTQYWYVTRRPDDEDSQPSRKDIHGPLADDQYQVAQQMLNLPPLTTRFRDLE